ncbi:hypothetical protein [Nocardia sp. NPDC058658]|uniref:hypothetical protein n=1 Tax=unclassified Nocardia TaxID=2637762 RepID=UPI003665EEFA
MTDPNTVGAAPVPLFSAPIHSEAKADPGEPVPGNLFPTFLTAAGDEDPTN